MFQEESFLNDGLEYGRFSYVNITSCIDVYLIKKEERCWGEACAGCLLSGSNEVKVWGW